MDEEDVGEALACARGGDPHAFARLWRCLQPSLLRYLQVVVGDAAHDVASETWLQAARDIRGFRGDSDGFRVWLFRVARNRCLDELRRAGRRRTDPLEQTDRAGTHDAADEALARLDTDWAMAVIATLPKDQAEAVMLRVVAALDVAQTAAVLGKRPGAVRIATMRGLRRLADHVEVKARRSAARRPDPWPVGPESPHPETV